jgi:hypothetical protein
MELFSSTELFSHIKEEFVRRGLLKKVVRLRSNGDQYSVRCDDDCFTLYRVNSNSHIPPGMPGWMVCRLSTQECFSLDEDHAACHWRGNHGHLEQARQWTRLVVALLDNHQD